MGINLDGWEAGVERVRNRVVVGVETTATEVHKMAVQRAPIRKAYRNTRSKKATVSDLADFSMKIKGGGSFTGDDIQEAASHIGVNLDASQVKALAAGHNLQVSQGSGQLGRGQGLNRTSSTAGMRGRRNLRILRGSGGMRAQGSPVLRKGKVEFNPRRRAFAVGKSTFGKLTSRARYDIRRGRGVILTGGGRFQYGGYLRKNIVLIEVDVDSSRIVFRVASKASYSRYVEFPTSRTAAQPFLLPALKMARNRLGSNIRRVKG